jgi:hypothetical protein
VSGTYSFNGAYQSIVSGSAGAGAISAASVTTTPGNVGSTALAAGNDMEIMYVTDTTNLVSFRITVIVGATFANNTIAIEQLV